MRALRTYLQSTSTWNPASAQRDLIRYIDVSAVSRVTLQIEELTSIPSEVAPGRARKIVRRNDTIFATIRPGLKRVAQVPEHLDNEIASTAFCVLRPDFTQIDPDYLFYLVSSDQFVESVAEHETGASYPAVSDRHVLDQQINVPTLAVQKEIAMALGVLRKSYLSEIDLERKAKLLKQATMRQLFTRGLRGEPQKETEIGLMPESWSVDSIGSHFNVVSGGTPSRGTSVYWAGGTIPWVKTTEVNYCVIKKTEEHITQAGLSDSAAKLLPEGTLLLAMYGQGVTRGRVAMLGIEATCNQACAAITKKDDAVVPMYLYHFLTWRYSAIRELAHGGQQQNLNLDIVREMPIAYPIEPEAQQHVVEILDAIDQKTALHKDKQNVLEELFRALLHKLMTGELSVSDLDLASLQDFATNGVAPATTERSAT